MTEHEFLEILNTQLTGQMPVSDIASHLDYYRNYIEDELKKGRKEEDILSGLGDPRLIARTLLDTRPEASIYSADTEYSDASGAEYFSGSDGRDSGGGSGHIKRRSYHLDLSTWYGKLIVIGIAAAVIFLLFIILGLLIPVAVVVFLVAGLISWFRRRS